MKNFLNYQILPEKTYHWGLARVIGDGLVFVEVVAAVGVAGVVAGGGGGGLLVSAGSVIARIAVLRRAAIRIRCDVCD